MRLRPAALITVSLLMSALVLAPAAPASAEAPRVIARLDAVDLPTLAHQVAPGGTLRLEGVELSDAKTVAAFELERFEVFTPDARVVVNGDNGREIFPVPGNLYFRGVIEGDPRSSVFLTVLEAGGLRGIVTSGGSYWVMEAETDGGMAPAGMLLREVDATTELAAKSTPFTCGNDQLDTPEIPSLLNEVSGVKLPVLPTPDKLAASYTARVAVETDYEFYQKLGGTQAATDYVADLFAFVSSIYAAEIDTTLMVSHISLWSSPGDPWTQTAASCGLFQFGRYWNDNNGGVERTIAHFLSGKNVGAGVAWIGVLCNGGFAYAGGTSSGCPDLVPDVDNYGGAYGYTSGISGGFDLNNPTVLWDVVALSHEIGHNFSSPHTHCYAGLDGNPEPVDECYSNQCGSSGCFCGTSSLPCAQEGAGCGTIMSYCHLRSGGYGNLSLTFGTNHPYGTAPERVPNRMRDHVVNTATYAPTCLAYQEGGGPANPDVLFADDFESGNLTRWN